MGWIGVDLDGTLAKYEDWRGGVIGEPVIPMVERVKRWLADGKDVRIFTARVWCDPQQWDYCGERGRSEDSYAAEALIKDWCRQHIGAELPVTCMKDYSMIELWDDRCVQVISNTGRTA